MPSDAERAVAMLRYANYAKVAEALLVSRASVADWAKGRSVTPYRVRQLEQLLRPDLQAQENEPPPWAEALVGEAAKKAIAELIPADVLSALPAVIARLEALQPRPGEASDDPPATRGRGAARRPAPGAG